tara:strand:+ start:79 stop:657 length:579 start_codon:yes stop_codon:yes gene_type:complete
MAILTNFGVPTGNGDTATTLMPKLQYRFRVTFNGLGNNRGPLVTKNVVSATRPGIDHDAVLIDTYNSRIHLAGKHTWQDVTIVLRDDTNNDVIKAIQEQLVDQVNHLDGSSAKAGSDYKFSMNIETLDGSQSTSASDGVIDRWVLVGAFIPAITFGDLNYATSEVVQVSMTIRFDHAELELAPNAVGQNATQ